MKKKNLLLITLFLIPTTFLFTFNKFIFIQHNQKEALDNHLDTHLKNSGFWDLTGSPIFIDDDDPVYNWAVIAAFEPWCIGLGTWNSPYIIENVTMDVLGGEFGINIVNSEVPFVIRNCTISNSGNPVVPYGIMLENVNNSIISNNKLYSIGTGIRLEYSNNNTIKINDISSNQVYGIHLYGYNYENIIFNNSFTENNYGISIITSVDNEIYKNVFFQNNYGITISGVSKENKVFENKILNNSDTGIRLYSSRDNKITKNFIANNLRGIYLMMNSHYNNFTENRIYNNSQWGLYFDNTTAECTNNLIYNNSFNNPDGINAFDDGTTTNWNNSIIGNYWQDYTGQDLDDNLIGDSPYNIYPGSGRIDYLPIWYSPPHVQINSPIPFSIFRDDINPPNFNVKITDPNLDSMWYTLNLESKKYQFYDNGTIEQSAWSDLPDGYITITFYANDSGGNINFKEVVVLKDTTAPLFNIISPLPGQVFGAISPSFVVHIIDFTLNKTWYSLDDGLNNFTFVNNESINQPAWSNLSDGIINITFYANDTGGKWNSTKLTVIKDTDAPNIIINFPLPNWVFQVVSPVFNIEIYDPHLTMMWYSIDGGITNTTFIHNDTIHQDLWDNAPDGEVTIIFYANDSVGNENSSSVTIIKETLNPLITIISPTENQIFGHTAPSFQISIIELNILHTWYTIDGGLSNITFTDETSIDQPIWNNAPDGEITITFYVLDIGGHKNSSSVTVIKDTLDPLITIISPEENQIFGDMPPSFQISIEEEYLLEVWYTIDEGNTNLTFSGLSGTIDDTEWNSAPEGEVSLQFYAKDISGNIGVTEVIIIKQLEGDQIIIGYEISVLFITFALSVLFVFKKIIREKE